MAVTGVAVGVAMVSSDECARPPSSAPVQSGLGIKVARWPGALHLTPRQ